MTDNPNARLLDCGWCYEEHGEEVHPHPECPVGRVVVPGVVLNSTPEPRELLKRAESYLSALHGSVARHDNLAANLGCAGCELRDQLAAELRRQAVEEPAPLAEFELRGTAEIRATALLEAADALGRMDYDTDSNDYGYDTYRDAWNGGVMDGAGLLRSLASEAQPAAVSPQPEAVHACPPDGSGLTPCCGRTPFELPRTDRMSTDPAAVTCAPAVVSQPDEEA